jgi:divalent metal cation (Fe/Co/Zn/Cd) transporter
MDGFTYYASLLLLLGLAYVFFQHNNSLLLLIVVVIGVYIVYSHETGHTATEFKDNVVESINEEAEGFNKKKGIERFDTEKLKEGVEEGKY